jgi:DNA helicase-2/ATP-dependent DNA helicase PcrA
MNFTPSQQDAINTIDKNLQIIACAGSGKTGVVTERIVNILKSKSDIKPENIVAFTYTEKAAGELKTRIYKRIKEELGDIPGMAEMYVGTIHSFCLNLLRDQYAEYQKYRVLDEVKTKLFIDKHTYDLGITKLMATTGKNMKPYKDTGIYMSMINILRESELEDVELSEELKATLEKYNELFEKHNFFDFTMIMERAIHHLENDELLRKKTAARIKYLTVDEYQDVNPIQEKLIRLIYDLGANICIVGDDDQTIYQWRGSEIKNILTFQDRYDIDVPVYLVDNFRSSKGIVDIAKRVIANNTERMQKDIVYKSQYSYEEGDIVYKEFENEADEYRFIAERIIDLKRQGLKYSDIAILLRIKKVGSLLIEILRNFDIDFIVEGVNELFSTDEVIAASNIFYYIKRDVSRQQLKDSWLKIGHRISETNIDKAINNLDKWNPEKHSYYYSFILQEIFHEFYDTLDLKEEEIRRDTKLEIILYNLGKFSQVIDDFETIYFMSKPEYKLKQFCNFIYYSADSYYPEGHLQNVYLKPDAVRIMTIHQSKGLEFPAVFIPTLTKNKFPQKKHSGLTVWHFLDREIIKNQKRYESGDIEDERRLFYVAVTRSKKYLFFTRAKYNTQAKEISVFLTESKKSPFIFEHSDAIDYSSRVFESEENDDTEIILNFSVLNDFYHCPYCFKLTYFYGFVQPLSPRLGYGRSLHDIVMKIHRTYTDFGQVDKSDLADMIENNFYLPYADTLINNSLKEKAQKSIHQYFDDNHKDFNKIIFSEKDIEIDLGNGIRVNGRIDLVKRMELDGERTFIVDFKTADREAYIDVSDEQLKIYALGYKKLSGENADYIEFYNLDKNEQDRKKLSSKDLEETENNIVNAARMIRGNMLDKSCSKSKCKECYVHHLCLKNEKKKEYGIKK